MLPVLKPSPDAVRLSTAENGDSRGVSATATSIATNGRGDVGVEQFVIPQAQPSIESPKDQVSTLVFEFILFSFSFHILLATVHSSFHCSIAML